MKRFETIREAWVAEKLVSSVRSATPCMVEEAGGDVISIQEPDGTRLYCAEDDGRIFSVFLPSRKLNAVAGVDPDMFSVSEKLKRFYKAGQVACLRLRNGEPPAEPPAHVDDERSLIDIDFLPRPEAYRIIAELAKRDPDALYAEDQPGDVPKFRPNKALSRITSEEQRESLIL